MTQPRAMTVDAAARLGVDCHFSTDTRRRLQQVVCRFNGELVADVRGVAGVARSEASCLVDAVADNACSWPSSTFELGSPSTENLHLRVQRNPMYYDFHLPGGCVKAPATLRADIH